MATAIKKCRVCGKLYEACHTLKRTDGTFRWQEVACSPECGATYLAKIQASRGVAPAKSVVNNEVEIVESIIDSVSQLVEDDEDEDEYYDELDEYFDDDDTEETAI